jgi:hypothetical protein
MKPKSFTKRSDGVDGPGNSKLNIPAGLGIPSLNATSASDARPEPVGATVRATGPVELPG